jgi:branched-chain amino acid transport system substrate-binding protein
MVAEEKPDAIFTTTYMKDGISIVRELRDAGYTGPVIDSGGGTISKDFINSLHDKAEGIYSVSELVYSLPAVRELNSRYHDRFGVNLSGASAYTYQAVLVIQDALNRSVTLEKDDIRNAISTTNITSDSKNLLPDDEIAFGPNGQNDFSRLTIMQVRNGTWKTVWPERYAESDETG